MQAFDVLGNPVRRRILELLASGPQPSGAIVEAVQRELDISQPGVSQHLAVLRESGFATVRADGARRVYELATGAFGDVDAWLDRIRGDWKQRLDALATEVARGKRERRLQRGKEPVRRRA
jgi:DNA-binding transcriptional ArsR family regulator